MTADSTPGDLSPETSGPFLASPPAIGAGPAEPGMWLTASAWLPATLLSALEEGASADGDHALDVAFRQAGPLDEMPPGPVLAAFLSECSAPVTESSPPPIDSTADTTEDSSASAERTNLAGPTPAPPARDQLAGPRRPTPILVNLRLMSALVDTGLKYLNRWRHGLRADRDWLSVRTTPCWA